MTFSKFSYKYHLWLSIVSLLVGLTAFSAILYKDMSGTIAMRVLMVIVFLAIGFLCFLLLPAFILALSILGRLAAFLPFINGDFSLISCALFVWALFNIATFILAFSGYDSDDEVSHLLF